MSSESLNVIALISGGKDSFFNIIHCLHHGHRIVALANLFPLPVGENSRTRHGDADDADDGHVQFIDPATLPSGHSSDQENDASRGEADLNSFMYQTVGHEVVPLYAAATGLPLYRRPILGAAVHHERDYAFGTRDGEEGEEEEETESMIPLLRFIKSRHPEANAVCSGAILSTYQRTRVESIALRLGLTPLAYLWKYTLLPPPTTDDGPADEAQLLRDMAAVGLEARIIKVASAGLDERHLWERVSSEEGVRRVQSALRKFGATEGAVLGEGGEFETIVLDGPSRLFKKRIAVSDEDRLLVREGGGSNWLMLRGARLKDKSCDTDTDSPVRVPDLLDSTFRSILDSLSDYVSTGSQVSTRDAPLGSGTSAIIDKTSTILNEGAEILRWPVLATSNHGASIESETRSVVETIRALLSEASLDASQIATTLVIIRNMADFPKVNAEYGKLFIGPNPPSRITISCGELLPDGHNIMIYVTAPDRNAAAAAGRDGLHVQSRSYWAPANIGPYSQAVDVAVTAGWEATGVRSVYVAGQIPLVPASMALPSASALVGAAAAATAGDTSLQIALSLQHLWRIGVEMKIQMWTSAVAYFAKTSSVADMERNAKVAGLAWRLAHARSDEETEDKDEDEDEGPDVWDLKFNPKYMSLGGRGGEHRGQEAKTWGEYLPDWSVFAPRRENEADSCVPPFFAAEVEELPRQSAVEWHAHTGLSGIGQGDVELLHHDKLEAPGWEAQHVIVRAEGADLVYTVLSSAYTVKEGLQNDGSSIMREAVSTSYRDAMRRLGVVEPPGESASDRPYLAYVDATETSDGMSHWMDRGAGGGGGALRCAVVPCRSVWAMGGRRMRCVALFKLTLRHAPASTTGPL